MFKCLNLINTASFLFLGLNILISFLGLLLSFPNYLFDVLIDFSSAANMKCLSIN